MNRRLALAIFLAAAAAVPALAQGQPAPQAAPPGRPAPTPNDTLVSPEVSGSTITFRLYAPEAGAVQVESEIGAGRSVHPMTKADDGVWSVSVEAPPGSYRYVFSIGGVSIVDPRNPVVSASNTIARSLVHVNGLAYQDMQAAPRGALSEVWYDSAEFGGPRRMHVYTPPGYEKSADSYPVLYLLHGAGDCDDSWGTVGRAGAILDNAIASGAALPMIVVMTWGHVPGGGFAPVTSQAPDADPILRDIAGSVIPAVEARYRVRTDADSRAIAGLSMGGGQTTRLGLLRPDLFHYVGVFSAGVSEEAEASLRAEHDAALRTAQASLKLLYLSTGVNDFAHPGYVRLAALARDYGFAPVTVEDEGDHSWTYWRRYLNDLAPRLFR